MKKIAFVIQHLTNGGAERTISNLTFALKNKYDVTLIVYDGDNVTYPYDAKFIDLKLPPVDGVFNKMLNLIKRTIKVYKIKKKEKFDCSVSFMFGGNIVNVLSNVDEKVVVSARNYMSAYGRDFISILREKFIAYFSDKEIALSKMVALDLNKNFGIDSEKIVTIYNPCDVEKIKSMSKEEPDIKFSDETFYIVSAGRMVKQKGHWHLLKAFSIFHDKVPDSRLLVLGDGELKKEIISLADKLGVTEYVDILGFVDNPYKYIARCNVFLLSSLFEGLGNVILEAMACEVPVISYDCLAGPRELIAPDMDLLEVIHGYRWCQCGILVEKPDFAVDFSKNISVFDKILSDAIFDMYRNPEKSKLVTENSSVNLNNFHPNKIMEKWEQLFEEING